MNDFSFQQPTIFFSTDSIVVKFDGMRRAVSTLAVCPETCLFLEDSYARQGNTLTKTFTQQDYHNAEPF